MEKEKLIGKTFEMLNIDDTIMMRFKIGKVKEEITPSITYADGSTYAGHTAVLVSENGSGWFRVYGERQDRIVE
jgi:hypothetical protein